MSKSDFTERREQRILRYKELAEKKASFSDACIKSANETADFIPLGQPILIGHHSQKKMERLYESVSKKMGRAFEESRKSEYYAQKAEAAEKNKSIFSDDPEVIKKLKEKLASLKEAQEKMKLINKKYNEWKKKGDKADFSGLTQNEIESVKKWEPPSYMGNYDKPFPCFKLTNNGAEIRRIKKRIEAEEIKASKVTTEETINGVRIVENVEENRIQIFFEGKPDEEIRAKLKARSFRWSPKNSAWQRHLSKQAATAAESILRSLSPDYL